MEDDDRNNNNNAIVIGGGGRGAGGRDDNNEFRELLGRVARQNPHVLHDDGATGRRQVPLLHYAVFMGYSLRVVQFLVETNPALVRTVSKRGELPVHCVGPNSRPEVCQLLIDVHPQALKRKDGRGRIPLHSALLLGAPIDIVRLYVETRPESVRIRIPPPRRRRALGPPPRGSREQPNLGDLPIHFAARGSRADAVALVQLFAPAWPESLLEVDGHGQTPLHLAAAASLDPADESDGTALIRELLLIEPHGRNALQARDFVGCVPLHSCLSGDGIWGPEREAMALLLLREWPFAAHCTVDTGELPIHIAAYCRSPEVVRRLLAIDPESVLCEARGWLPIHMAVEATDAHVEVARRLAEPRPEVLLVQNPEGLTPMHIVAAAKNYALAAVLAELSPESLLVANSEDGSLPVHIAMDALPRAACVGLTSVLVGPSRQALMVANGAGSLPVHVALRNMSRASSPEHFRSHGNQSLVQYLVEQSPASLRVQDGDGNLPLHVAVALPYVSELLVSILVKPFPESLYELNSAGLIPLSVAVSHANQCAASAERTEREGHRPQTVALAFHSVTVVGLLVEMSPESLRVANSDGNLPVHLAASEPNASVEVLLAIVKPRPTSLHVGNAMGSLPLHLAVSRTDAKVDVVRVLIQLGGSATLQHRDAEGFAPLHRAAQQDAPLDVIFELVSAGPGVWGLAS